MVDQAEELEALQARVDSDFRIYEVEIATERRKLYLLHLEWANRFLQMQKLMPMSVAVANVDQDVEKSPRFAADTKFDPTEVLTNDQFTYFSDIKDAFWADGHELGHTEADIAAKWAQKMPQVLENVQREVNSGPSDASN